LCCSEIIDYRWGGGDAARYPGYVAELVAPAPDVILAAGASVLPPLLQATRAVPIVFVLVVDPVGAGFVASLGRPGGNVTGFSQFEYALSGKWLELIKEIAPKVTRAAVIRDPAIASGIGQFGAIQALAPSLGVEVTPFNVRDAGESRETDCMPGHIGLEPAYPSSRYLRYSTVTFCPSMKPLQASSECLH
jgi:ABC-type uncharacterized transport system substrate-binding protein